MDGVGNWMDADAMTHGIIFNTVVLFVKHKGDKVRAANLICGCGGNREVMRYDE